MPASPGIRCNAVPVQTHRDTLWAIAIGIFMTSVDDTVVYVANPSIMAGLNTSYHMVIWVTSGYVLAYTVPSLVAGRWSLVDLVTGSASRTSTWPDWRCSPSAHCGVACRAPSKY